MKRSRGRPSLISTRAAYSTKHQAVIYRRVSTKEQVSNMSLDNQERQCRAFCEKDGYVVDRVFTDEGESAKTADRPQLTAMLAYCCKNKDRIGAVIVYNASRLARSLYDHVLIKKQLADNQIVLRSTQENFDDSDSGFIAENFSAMFAELDNRKRARQTVDGMIAGLDQGRWTFKPPLGYIKALDGSGKRQSFQIPREPI